jgi:hypothetical protein
MNEVWLPIEGYEGTYEVSNLGQVRSLDRTVETKAGPRRCKGRILKQRVNRQTGYWHTNLNLEGKMRTYQVHRLVALAFLGPPGDGEQVDHRNNDRTDNRLVNLRWATGSENLQNQRTPKNNTSGVKGVTWFRGKWKVQVYHQGRQYYGGLFTDLEEAVVAVRALRRRLHDPEFLKD